MRRGIHSIPGTGEAYRYDVDDSLDTLNEYMGRIRDFCLHAIGAPEMIDMARKVTLACQPFDQRCEVSKVWDFVLTRIRYAPSPARYGIETIQTHEKLADEIIRLGRASGECEEIVVFLTGLLGALNHRVALVYGGDQVRDDFGGMRDNFKHVWCAVKTDRDREWIHLDPTAYGKYGRTLLPGQHFAFPSIGWDILDEE